MPYVANIKKKQTEVSKREVLKFLVMGPRKLFCISSADLVFVVGKIFASIDTTCMLPFFFQCILAHTSLFI